MKYYLRFNSCRFRYQIPVPNMDVGRRIVIAMNVVVPLYLHRSDGSEAYRWDDNKPVPCWRFHGIGVAYQEGRLYQK